MSLENRWYLNEKQIDDFIRTVIEEVNDTIANIAINTAAIAAKEATAQSDSTATDVAGIVADFNALLAKLRTAGLMASE